MWLYRLIILMSLQLGNQVVLAEDYDELTFIWMLIKAALRHLVRRYVRGLSWLCRKLTIKCTVFPFDWWLRTIVAIHVEVLHI